MNIIKATNQQLNDSLLKKRETLLKNGENYPGHIDKSGNGTAFIRPEDEEAYDTINELMGYLDFGDYDPDHTYIIPGVKLKGITNKQGKALEMPICIKEEAIENILRNVARFERIGLKIPAQIYQFRYKNENVPNKPYKAPRPRLIGEDEKEYEKFLRDYYESYNEKPIIIEEDINFRETYIHERIDYSKANVVDPRFASEYYYTYSKQTLKNAQPAPQRRNNPVASGEEYEFRESENAEKIPFAQKIGRGYQSLKTNLSNGSVSGKVKAVLGVALTVGAIGFAVTNSYIAPAIPVALAAFVGAKYGSKLVKKIYEKVKDKLYGPRLPEQPTEPAGPTQGGGTEQDPPTGPTGGQGTGGSGASGGTQQPPTGDRGERRQPSDDNLTNNISSFLEEMGLQKNTYEELETRIKGLETILRSIPQDSQEYKDKKELLDRLRKDKRTILENVAEMIRNYGFTNENGGRTL